MTHYLPTFDEHHVAFCSQEGCAQYDGKRCRLTGFRPNGICEPWARNVVSVLRDIAYDPGCGCSPCTGQCVSREALADSLAEIRELARSAINGL